MATAADINNTVANVVDLPASSAGTAGRRFYVSTVQAYYLDTGSGWSAEPVGGAGGGDSTYSAAYGSRPAASNTGDLFFPSDGFVVERDTGAAWVPWGPLFPFTAPVNGDFAWVNQGTATVSTTNGSIYLSAPAIAGGNCRIRKKAAPSTPYTITAAFLPHLPPAASGPMGLCWRESASGKLVLVDVQMSTAAAMQFRVTHYTNETTFSATVLDLSTAFMTMRGLMIVRIEDDGANRKVHVSADGQNFMQVYSAARTTFCTPDEVGFFAGSEQATYPVGLTLLSWKQA